MSIFITLYSSSNVSEKIFTYTGWALCN
ncbi:unnamed protein product [Acanthoscelides obtectus]|uniref:Uncharacterized protein n=1 Tax=Acanthoscelides obtectus TaxID=200917 RepID=A0A9P0LS89_ACAOB|nr:unnamed protein product [Acanthoscelides obtectus]CAK1670912.1 hypothetical protein AOBTE_LOCUS27912 [Acanthoscelides obtectus]